MKNSMIFCAVIIAVLFVSCKQEQATQSNIDEDVFSISWIVENPMSTVPYISIFSNQNEMICYQTIHTDSIPLIARRDTIILDPYSWDEIKSFLNLEEFLNLQDNYPMNDSMLQDYPTFFLEVKTTT